MASVPSPPHGSIPPPHERVEKTNLVKQEMQHDIEHAENGYEGGGKKRRARGTGTRQEEGEGEKKEKGQTWKINKRARTRQQENGNKHFYLSDPILPAMALG